MTAGEHGTARCTGDQHCITCGDDGVPMRVVAVSADGGIATCVDAAGSASEVLTGIVAPVAMGDRLLVHGGAALLRLAMPLAGDPV